MAKRGSTSRIWIALAVLFFLTTLSGSGYVLWRELWSLRLTPDVIIQRFSALFRTDSEQTIFTQQYFKSRFKYKPVNTTVNVYQCSINCSSSNTTPAPMTSGRVFHHACCQSTVSFESREEMINLFGVPKKIAQFKEKKQFFKIETCSHIVGFAYGRCELPEGEYTTAVTVDEELSDNDINKYKIEWVEVPGSCKCMN